MKSIAGMPTLIIGTWSSMTPSVVEKLTMSSPGFPPQSVTLSIRPKGPASVRTASHKRSPSSSPTYGERFDKFSNRHHQSYRRVGRHRCEKCPHRAVLSPCFCSKHRRGGLIFSIREENPYLVVQVHCWKDSPSPKQQHRFRHHWHRELVHWSCLDQGLVRPVS